MEEAVEADTARAQTPDEAQPSRVSRNGTVQNQPTAETPAQGSESTATRTPAPSERPNNAQAGANDESDNEKRKSKREEIVEEFPDYVPSF
jgi:hypothetical protein